MGLNNSKTTDIRARPDERGDLLEYSVIYTDRAINMLSSPFQTVMKDLSSDLKKTYNAKHIALIPGSGTFAMEAAARQFATDKKTLIMRNGYFSFRWTEIIEVGKITDKVTVVKAHFDKTEENPQLEPALIEDLCKLIDEEKPEVVFAPQVETSTGVVLSKEYIKTVAASIHKNGGIFVLDAIAAGTLWIDMEDLGVDVIISAPQKGWSGPSCCGIVLLNETAYQKSLASSPSSFSCNLTKWLQVMEKYENGGAMYHTTLPTDSLTAFRNSVKDTLEVGAEKVEESAKELGKRMREACEKRGLKSVAKDSCKAPTVVVSYTKDKGIVQKFKKAGVQVVGGVPFKVDEPEGLICFRIGLFGLDKLKNVDRTVKLFEEKLDKVLSNL